MTNTKSKATRLGFAKTLLSASIAVAISPTLVAQEQAGTAEADVEKMQSSVRVQRHAR